MSDHTEGPWDWFDNGPETPSFVTAKNVIVAAISGHPRGRKETANCHLIASAPDMLAALEKLANEVEGLGAFEPEIREAIGNTNWSVLRLRMTEAHAAIAKARGES